jgi:GT2 family glycosyltransferase
MAGSPLEPPIDVVVVNWNSGQFLGRCLQSIERYSQGRIGKVVVVDNASADQSRAAGASFSTGIFDFRYLQNNANAGFAAACNQGATQCGAAFVLFLNPDCELNRDTIRNLLDETSTLPMAEYGAFGVKLVDAGGSIARVCSRQPNPADFWTKLLGLDRVSLGYLRSHVMTEWNHEESRDVEHVIGAFYLVRRTVFQDLDGFDERFFVYLEDLDLSRRIARAGLRIRYLAGAQAFHAGGGASRNVKAERLFYSLSSRILFGFKHFPPWSSWILFAATMLIEPIVRLSHTLLTARFAELGHTAAAYARLWGDCPRLLMRRTKPL